jgi:hypothetical protein
LIARLGAPPEQSAVEPAEGDCASASLALEEAQAEAEAEAAGAKDDRRARLA